MLRIIRYTQVPTKTDNNRETRPGKVSSSLDIFDTFDKHEAIEENQEQE